MTNPHPCRASDTANRTKAWKWFIPVLLLLLLAFIAVLVMPGLRVPLTQSANAEAKVEISDQWVAFGPMTKQQVDLDPATLTRVPKKLTVDGKVLEPVTVTAYDGIASLREVTGKETGSAAYVFIPIRSDADCEFELGLGADYWLTAYLNGQEVADTWQTGNSFFYGAPWPPHQGNLSVTVQLKKGENLLALRFAKGRGGALLAVGEAVDHHGTTWIVQEPLYEELIAHGDRKIKSAAVTFNYRQRMVERIGGISPAMDSLGLMYGLPATREMYRQDAEKHRLHTMTHVNYLIQDEFMDNGRIRIFGDGIEEWLDRTGVGFYVAGDFLYYDGHGVGLYRNKKMHLDALKKHKHRMWALWLGDEVVYHFTSQTLAVLTGDYKTYLRPRYQANIERAKKAGAIKRKDLDATRQKIKQEYGFGKFDLPSGLKADNEPFRWIAFNRWLLDELLVAQKQLWEIADESEKRFGYRPWVMSNDARDEATPHLSSRFGEYADILMVQVHGGRDGRWGQPGAFAAKLRADLSGKDVWPCVHIDTHGMIETAEEANEQLSQVLRGGGSGFFYWDRDIKGHGRGHNDSGVDYYGHPGRYKVFTNAVDLAMKIGALKRPEPDFAMFVSNDTAMSRFSNAMSHNTRSIFYFFGPIAGSWFTYISDAQIEDGKVDPADWNTIFLADCAYQRGKVSEAILKAAMSGGKTVVALDGEVFTHDIDGTKTPKYMRELFGVTVEDGTSPRQIVIPRKTALLPDTEPGTTLPMNQAWVAQKISLEPGVEVIATFDDGSPAMTVKKLPGGGRGIYCAFTWNHRNMVVSPWRDFARSFAKGLGFKTDQDIWRFQFPMPEEAKNPPSYDNGEPVALTGNNFHWWENRPLIRGNAEYAGGRYRFSLAPDAPAEERAAIDGWHSFLDGDLTDRLDAFDGPNFVSPHGETLQKVRSGELSTNMYTVGWKKPDAIDIEFDLGRAASLTEARLVFKGSLPSVTLLGSSDGSNYEVLGQQEGLRSEDVPEIVVKAKPASVRYVKLRIPERGPDETLRLAEITLWGLPK